MTTVDFITTLFCHVDDRMGRVAKHSQALLYPSELVTIGILYALKGCGERAFYRWLTRDYRPLFPRLPERTRLFRALTAHRAWTDYFLAEPSLLGVADSYGVELIHPRREGRSSRPWGTKESRIGAGSLGPSWVLSSIIWGCLSPGTAIWTVSRIRNSDR